MPQDGNPTIKDVAAEAGVHPSTVSRALANHPGIPAKTRDRIQALAKSMGYQINPLTAALMKSRRRRTGEVSVANLGFLVPQHREAAWQPRSWIYEVFQGAQQEAREMRYGMDVYWAEDGIGNPPAFERMLRNRGVHGLIIAPEHEAPMPFNLDWSKFGVISLHHGASKVIPRFNQIVSNHFHSVLEICRHCEALGYRRPGLVLRDHPDIHREYGRSVFGAYTAGMAQSSALQFSQPLILQELEVYRIAQWAQKQKVDAIIQAGGGYSPEFDPGKFREALEQHGVNIPDEVGLLIMGHRPEFDLATVDERTETIGGAAVRFLIEDVQQNRRGPPEHPIIHQLEAEIHLGNSLPPRKG